MNFTTIIYFNNNDSTKKIRLLIDLESFTVTEVSLNLGFGCCLLLYVLKHTKKFLNRCIERYLETIF